LIAARGGCGLEAAVAIDDLPDGLLIPDVGLRLRCSK
jgi:hypothetical protein